MDTENSDVFLDPTLVDMKTLSAVAYNYRWATLPDGVIPLTAASSDFPVCSAITNALKNHVDAGYFCYGPNEGLPQFRSTFATYFSEKLVRGLAYCNNKLELEQQEDNTTTLYGASSIDPGQVMATNAAAAAVYAAAAATILEPGDEALVMSPVDFLLVDSVIALGGVVVRYSIKERLQNGDKSRPTFDLAEMESLLTPRTRMLSICNPHNPLGRSFSYIELSALVEFAERHKLFIVSDEVWCDVVHSPRVHLPTMCISQYAAAHTYTIFGFSKSHGLEGLRIGALIAPNEEKLAKVLMLSNTSTTANGASVAAQIAAVAAMTEAGSHESGWLASWRLHLHACVLYTVTRLNAMEGVIANVPEATFVVWADVSSLLYPDNDGDDGGTHLVNDDAVATVDIEPEFVLMQWLIHEHKVAIIPGLDRFFGPGSIGHIRISVATSKPILDTALDRLELGIKVWPAARKRALHDARVEAVKAQGAMKT
jgi:aspartate/methionine/tyrosine aminotransferase